MSISRVRGCSGNSFTASRMVRLCTAKLPCPSTLSSTMVVFITFSLSEAVMVSWLPSTSKRKQSRIAKLFLLLRTLARVASRLLRAELDNVNLMSI